MTVPSTVAPLPSRPGRRLATAVGTLVLVVAAGLVGWSNPAGATTAPRGQVITGEAVGHLSPDAVRSGARIQPGPSSRSVGHRLPIGSPAANPGGGSSRHSLSDGGSVASARSAISSSASSRGPPHPVV